MIVTFVVVIVIIIVVIVVVVVMRFTAIHDIVWPHPDRSLFLYRMATSSSRLFFDASSYGCGGGGGSKGSGGCDFELSFIVD